MSAPPRIPFVISPSAEQRLKQVGAVPGMQPGICRTLRYYIKKDGELTEEFIGEHYFVGFNPPAYWESAYSAVCVTIIGRDFWLPSETVDSIRDKKLTVVKKHVGRGKFKGRKRDILVAVDS